MRSCITCGLTRPLREFTFRKDNKKYRPSCKPCRSNESQIQRYGMTLDEVEKLKVEQDNRCAICGVHASDIDHASFKHNPLVIDHDHATGKVRGLLCPKCNFVIGNANDSVAVLLAAVAYLSR